jgi:predicted peroxiredoxin
MFLTKEAVRLALTDFVQGVACDGCPTLPALAERYAAAGGRMLVCPICFNARKLSQDGLIESAELAAPPRYGSRSVTAPPCSATDDAFAGGAHGTLMR